MPARFDYCAIRHRFQQPREFSTAPVFYDCGNPCKTCLLLWSNYKHAVESNWEVVTTACLRMAAQKGWHTFLKHPANPRLREAKNAHLDDRTSGHDRRGIRRGPGLK